MSDIDYLVVVDLETTGLNELWDVPLEIGVAVVNSCLEVVSTAQSLVLSPNWEMRLEFAKEHVPAVWDMHIESGLIKDLQNAEESGAELNPVVVDETIYNWLRSEAAEGTFPMTGSSIHFDRRFTRSFFPKTESFFTYRIADVSSLKEFCKFFNPELYAKLPPAKKAKHRVLSDIENTLDELAWYRDNFIWVGDDR